MKNLAEQLEYAAREELDLRGLCCTGDDAPDLTLGAIEIQHPYQLPPYRLPYGGHRSGRGDL